MDMWPRLSDLDEPGRSIVAGALAVVERLAAAKADPASLAIAVQGARDVAETVRGAYDPQQAIGEYLQLEATLYLS